MDCEKFDLHAIDALYGELDELTLAAMKRHMDGCARCTGVLSGLRATREVGLLPIEEPSDELEARILDAVDAAQRTTPWHRRVVRVIAWAGSQAMRPQLAAAALLVLILGSSLLLLRPKPGSVGASPVSVTERGVPDPESPDKERARADRAPAALAAPAVAPGAAASAAPEQASPAATALAMASPPPSPPSDLAVPAEVALSKGLGEAKAKDDSGAKDASAALQAARALRDTVGCRSALAAFDKVGTTFPGTSAAADAMWDEASCYKATGDGDKARELFMALASAGKYRSQAQQELAQAQAQLNNQVGGGPPAAGAAARAAAAPMPAPKAAKPVAADAPSGGASPRNAAPAKANNNSF